MNLRVCTVLAALLSLSAVSPAFSQMTLSGRVQCPRFPGSSEVFYLPDIVGFATPVGSKAQSAGTRTWETEPTGWSIMSGVAGNNTVVFAGPGMFMRPLLLTNQFFEDGERVDRPIVPRADYAMMSPQAWDPHAATDYFQTFVARSRSVTNIGFKLAHDGVDGPGPGVQNLIASVHRGESGTPDTWEQIGPAVPVLNVNAGGSLDISYAAGWNSGEVPLEPGKTYAVHLRAETPGRGFQCFWRKDAYPDGDCYRLGADGKGFAGFDQWLYVAGDGDGLLVPYNKRVQREFHSLTKFGRKWSQTYVAQGRGLAAVMLYAAVATSQPPLILERVIVRVRRGGPDGPVVGIEKIAIGQGTAGAESGVFGMAATPGEIPLEPGQTYAVEFESFGPDVGFNPVMKQPRDPYDLGTAWFDGRTKMDYDLDMIVVEYEAAGTDWADAVDEKDYLVNGDMQRGSIDATDHAAGGPEGWKRFAIDPGTAFWYIEEKTNRFARVIGGSISSRTVDGGYLQPVGRLNHRETYRLSGRVRSSWPLNDQHQILVGFDPTGQTENAKADTIHWAILPHAHGVFEFYQSPPIRPRKDAISIWLRGRTTSTERHPFEADFDDFRLRRVRATPP